MIIAIPGQKDWKEADTVENGFIEMDGEPPSENHYAIGGKWLTPDEFMH